MKARASANPARSLKKTHCPSSTWITRTSTARQAICRAILLSIRIGQAIVSVHFRPSRSNAFAMTMSLRMTAVKASFLHFPVDTSWSYLAFISGLNRVATTAGR